MYASQSWVKELVTRLFKKNNEYMLSKTNSYSLEEQVVGTWIDGKPLYQKTFTDITITSNDIIDIDISNLNYDTIIDVKGRLFNSDYGHWLGVSNYYANSIATTEYINNNGKKIVLGNFSRAITKGHITIQYTKTTD